MNTAVDHRWEKVFRFQIPLFHAGEEFRESFFQFFYERCRQSEHIHGNMLVFFYDNRVAIVVSRMHAVFRFVDVVCLCDLGEVSVIVHGAHAAGYRSVFA